MLTLCDTHKTWTLPLSDCPVCRCLAAEAKAQALAELVREALDYGCDSHADGSSWSERASEALGSADEIDSVGDCRECGADQEYLIDGLCDTCYSKKKDHCPLEGRQGAHLFEYIGGVESYRCKCGTYWP